MLRVALAEGARREADVPRKQPGIRCANGFVFFFSTCMCVGSEDSRTPLRGLAPRLPSLRPPADDVDAVAARHGTAANRSPLTSSTSPK